MKLVTVLLLCLLGASSLGEKIRYDGFKVYRVVPRSQGQLEALRMLEQYHLGYYFWSEVVGVDIPVDIMVPPHLSEEFNDLLKLQQLESSVSIENVQERIDNENPREKDQRFGWTAYYTLDEIYSWLSSVAEEHSEVTLVEGGSTFEGRVIKGVRISFSPDNADNAVFIEGGIHAREWISPAFVTYLINDILTTTNATVEAIYKSYDWYIFPVTNPDGYVYSHTTARLWRKTRIPYGACYGADPNRNWDYRWNTGGASNNPCSDIFAGPFPFSENSTRTLSEFIASVSSNLKVYLAIHSFSQMLLFPYGHTSDHLDNHDELLAVGIDSITALARRFGTRYVVGNIAETIYVATGGSLDWVKGTFGTRVTYAYELRDTGRYGFLLPADQILPTSLETIDSLVPILTGFK